jgi:hypothetical protein
MLVALALGCSASPAASSATDPVAAEPPPVIPAKPARPTMFDAAALELLAVQCGVTLEPEQQSELAVVCGVIYLPDSSVLRTAAGRLPVAHGLVDVDAVEALGADLLREVLAPLHKSDELEI